MPASRVAWRWLSLKYAGTVITALLTIVSSSCSTLAFNALRIKELSSMLSARIDKVDKRIEEAEAKLAMWINRGVGVWALAVTLFTAYKAFIN